MDEPSPCWSVDEDTTHAEHFLQQHASPPTSEAENTMHEPEHDPDNDVERPQTRQLSSTTTLEHAHDSIAATPAGHAQPQPDVPTPPPATTPAKYIIPTPPPAVQPVKRTVPKPPRCPLRVPSGQVIHEPLATPPDDIPATPLQDALDTTQPTASTNQAASSSGPRAPLRNPNEYRREKPRKELIAENKGKRTPLQNPQEYIRQRQRITTSQTLWSANTEPEDVHQEPQTQTLAPPAACTQHESAHEEQPTAQPITQPTTQPTTQPAPVLLLPGSPKPMVSTPTTLPLTPMMPISTATLVSLRPTLAAQSATTQPSTQEAKSSKSSSSSSSSSSSNSSKSSNESNKQQEPKQEAEPTMPGSPPAADDTSSLSSPSPSSPLLLPQLSPQTTPIPPPSPLTIDTVELPSPPTTPTPRMPSEPPTPTAQPATPTMAWTVPEPPAPTPQDMEDLPPPLPEERHTEMQAKHVRYDAAVKMNARQSTAQLKIGKSDITAPRPLLPQPEACHAPAVIELSIYTPFANEHACYRKAAMQVAIELWVIPLDTYSIPVIKRKFPNVVVFENPEALLKVLTIEIAKARLRYPHGICYRTTTHRRARDASPSGSPMTEALACETSGAYLCCALILSIIATNLGPMDQLHPIAETTTMIPLHARQFIASTTGCNYVTTCASDASVLPSKKHLFLPYAHRYPESLTTNAEPVLPPTTQWQFWKLHEQPGTPRLHELTQPISAGTFTPQTNAAESTPTNLLINTSLPEHVITKYVEEELEQPWMHLIQPTTPFIEVPQPQTRSPEALAHVTLQKISSLLSNDPLLHQGLRYSDGYDVEYMKQLDMGSADSIHAVHNKAIHAHEYTKKCILAEDWTPPQIVPLLDHAYAQGWFNTIHTTIVPNPQRLLGLYKRYLQEANLMHKWDNPGHHLKERISILQQWQDEPSMSIVPQLPTGYCVY